MAIPARTEKHQAHSETREEHCGWPCRYPSTLLPLWFCLRTLIRNFTFQAPTLPDFTPSISLMNHDRMISYLSRQTGFSIRGQIYLHWRLGSETRPLYYGYTYYPLVQRKIISKQWNKRKALERSETWNARSLMRKMLHLCFKRGYCQLDG